MGSEMCIRDRSSSVRMRGFRLVDRLAWASSIWLAAFRRFDVALLLLLFMVDELASLLRVRLSFAVKSMLDPAACRVDRRRLAVEVVAVEDIVQRCKVCSICLLMVSR